MNEDPKPAGTQSEFSKALRAARDAYQHGDPGKSLEILDRKTAETSPEDTARLSRLAALVAHGEYKLGRYAEAVHCFRAAARVLGVSGGRRAWAKPALGEVRALLKQGLRNEARERALSHWETCLGHWAAGEKDLAASMEELREKGKIRIGARPVRPSVFAAKLGNLFFEKSMFEDAGRYFRSALQANPEGACRARQGLARIAMATGDYAAAERRSRQALQLGEYHAKTLPSWAVLVTARVYQGKRGLLQEDFDALAAVPVEGVWARATYTVVKELRRHGEERWRAVARKVLRGDAGGQPPPAFALELEKLLLADARLSGGPPEHVFRTAARILRSRTAKPADVCAAAKEYARAACILGREPDGPALAGRFSRRWNASVCSRVLHSMAKGALLARRQDLAAAWLRENCSSSSGAPAGRKGRSRHALAAIEESAGNPAAARAVHWEIASDPVVPAHGRVRALLRWADLPGEGGAAPRPEAVTSLVEDIVSHEKRSVGLLTIARELSLRGGALGPAAARVLGLAEAAVGREVAGASHPAKALAKTLPLMRKLFFDFQDYPRVASLWEAFLASWGEAADRAADRYWSGAELYVRATLKTRGSGARRPAEALVEDPATPAAGVALLGRALVVHHVYRGGADTRYALGIARAVATSTAATHPAASTAHYWTALAALGAGDTAGAEKSVAQGIASLGNRISLLQDWRLKARFLLLKNAGDPAAVTGTEPKFSGDFVTRQQHKLARDREVVSPS